MPPSRRRRAWQAETLHVGEPELLLDVVVWRHAYADRISTIRVEVLMLRHERDVLRVQIGRQRVVLVRERHAGPERVEQTVPVIRDVDLRMNDRDDELRDRQSSPVPIHASTLREAGVLHRRREIGQRRAVVHPVDDDVLVEIERARRVVDEETRACRPAVDGEEERAAAAAVRIILADAGAEPAGRGSGTGGRKARARSAGSGWCRCRCG